MDECDFASRNTEFYLKQALKGQLEKAAHNTKESSRCTCIDCGEAIPAARQKIVPGCRRCVACQNVYEKNGNNKKKETENG